MDAPDPNESVPSRPAVDAVLDAYALKDERRTGWQLRGVTAPESVAAHSWGVAYLAVAFGDSFREEFPELDLEHALRLAIVHDVAEATLGDVPTRADETASSIDREEAAAAEREAMSALAGPLSDRITDAFEEYEARETPEAVVIKECDLLETCVQAIVYERDDRYDPADGTPEAFTAYDALDEFFVTSERRLQTATGNAIFSRLRDRYQTHRTAEENTTE